MRKFGTPKSHTELLEELKMMCGMGRTGTLHACAQENVRPDIMIIAKGLGGGYQPIGAMLASGEISDAIAAGSGDFQHGHTYIGHATACAAALAVQQTVRDERLLDAVRARGAELAAAFAQHLGSHPHVGDIRGRGLFWGLELVSDRAGKTPFDLALKMHARVKREAMACGLCCYPRGGTVDGRLGNQVLIAPPFIITSAQIDGLVDKLAEAIEAAITSARS